MRNKILYLGLSVIILLSAKTNLFSQHNAPKVYTYADTVRGSILPERAWWNVLRYDLTIKPDFENKNISGKNIIQYNVLNENNPHIMQIDLQEPMNIDSIILNSSTKLDFKRNGNAYYSDVPGQELNSDNSVTVFFHGKPHESTFPPWDAGFVWKKDSLGNPWMSAACQGGGASVWYPCKDHQSDEPDNGASLTMIVPDDLTAVANGRLNSKIINEDGTVSYKWEVVNPINNYNIIPYVGKYVNISDIYNGEKGALNIELWVLDYNTERAREHILPEVKRMLEAFEHWFGPYPFYEDSYKIIDAPYPGMEHQSGIAYGNRYLFGYWGKDRSQTGWGMKFDYMIVHESAHEWFGNSITSNDIADMWIHEAFGDYSEALFIEYWYNKDAAIEYNNGLRKSISNKTPITGNYGVNSEGSSDMYPKGSNMLNSIRHSIDNDEKFREILRGMNNTFYHKTVDAKEIEDFISDKAGFDYSKVFDQYLKTIQIPVFEYNFSKDGKKVNFRYTNCIEGFNLPLALDSGGIKIKIFPSTEWSSMEIMPSGAALFNTELIEKMYYIKVNG